MLEIQNRLFRSVNKYNLWRLEKNVIELNNVGQLKKIFNWSKEPTIDDPILSQFEVTEDVNERRLRDAEVLGTASQNITTSHILEIGTSSGHGTALMALNAPAATVHTINILPNDDAKSGGYNTFILEKKKIGAYYKDLSLKNVDQIYANTATWKPHLTDVGLAFIDGCHDTKFVVNDTRKALQCMPSGSFILWHDFHPGLMKKYDWIYEVCLGVEKLIAKKIVRGRIFHVKDSWIGLYRVP